MHPPNKQAHTQNDPPPAQSWGDEDIPPVLEAMGDALRRGVTAMSGFDKYKKEVCLCVCVSLCARMCVCALRAPVARRWAGRAAPTLAPPRPPRPRS